MKYIIIGEPCVDVIHKINGEVFNGYGGILYSVISLAVLSDKSDKIFPVFNIGDDEYANVLSFLMRYENISTDGIRSIVQPTRKVDLYYNLQSSDSKESKLETSTQPLPEIEYDRIDKFFHEADAVLINMISGVDIGLETFKAIRKNFPGLIHIDIHNLVLKTADDGTRYHVPPDNWHQWCSNSDTVQMNEIEVISLSKDKKNEYQVSEEILLNKDSLVKGVIVTKGADGVTGYTKKENKFGENIFFDLERHDLGAIENPHFADSTGCGDVFASAFVLEYSQSRDFMKGLRYANRIASYKTSLEGINGLDKLR